MKRIFKYIISKNDENKTIWEFLKEQGYSHHIFVWLKSKENSVILNNKPVYLNQKLTENDILTVFYEENSASENIVPSDIPLNIIYEDEDIILINKQANVPVHPSIRHYENTIANGLCHYFNQKGEAFTFRCINRLDIDTTGLILIAKHGISGCILSDSMKRREIKREYLSIVSGMIPPKGTICVPIARKENSIIERCVDFENGEFAKTNYERVSYKNGYSLVKLHLDTGRTHQIRVHMKYINHPLPGDYLYNPVYDKINRQPLHSSKLTFVHPITKKTMEFNAKLPDDFKAFF